MRRTATCNHTGATATQVTSTGQDSMASYSPDGQWIYYIEAHHVRGFYPCGGGPAAYSEPVPNLVRLPTSGGAAQQLATGKFTSGSYSWFSRWQPVASPDGRPRRAGVGLANPCVDDVVLQFYDLSTKRMTSAGLPRHRRSGDRTAWSPDGNIVYVRNGREGAIGTPVIDRYDLSTKAEMQHRARLPPAVLVA